MKKIFSLSVMALLAVAATAQVKMVVVQSDGGSEEFDLATTQKLTFADSYLNVSNTLVAAQPFSLANVRLIKFTNAATAIETVSRSSADRLSFAYANGTISVNGLSKPTNATLYTIGGQQVSNQSSWDGSPLSVATLPQGVYILKVGQTAYKFVKK